jgi:hypothetical protein
MARIHWIREEEAAGAIGEACGIWLAETPLR